MRIGDIHIDRGWWLLRIEVKFVHILILLEQGRYFIAGCIRIILEVITDHQATLTIDWFAYWLHSLPFNWRSCLNDIFSSIWNAWNHKWHRRIKGLFLVGFGFNLTLIKILLLAWLFRLIKIHFLSWILHLLLFIFRNSVLLQLLHIYVLNFVLKLLVTLINPFVDRWAHGCRELHTTDS